MRRQHMLGGATVLGMLVVLLLITIALGRHPASVQAAGSRLLWIDVALLLTYGVAGIWVWRQTRPDVIASVSVGAQAGVLLGAVHVANHVIESLMSVRPFVLIITPVFLMLALFGAAGSLAWQRARSLVLAVTAGVWCAVVATLIALSLAFCLNLTFEENAKLQQHTAFAASGMTDPGAFLVKTMLEATSEGLVRMPLFALFLSLTGAVTNAWINRASRRTALIAAFLAPFTFSAGAAGLWYANSLERAARPPFVMAGVILAGVALCSAHAIWSALRPSCPAVG